MCIIENLRLELNRECSQVIEFPVHLVPLGPLFLIESLNLRQDPIYSYYTSFQLVIFAP